MTMTPGKNALDPILPAGPEQERALFEALNKCASGHDFNVAAGAATNMLANIVRQACPTRQQAERMFDELSGRAKNLLMEKHYDAVTGKRRSVFPFEQRISAALVHWNDELNKK